MGRALTPQETNDVYEYIRNFLAEELAVPLEQIGPDTKIIDDLHGDSMIYLELIDVFKKKYDVKVELSLIGRYLQKNPVRTVGEASRLVCAIVEGGDALLMPGPASEAAGPSASRDPGVPVDG